MRWACRLIAEAKAWLNKAKGVTQSRTLLKRMREVLHAGLRLGTELPQVEQLRQEIRKREWEAHAQKVQAPPPASLSASDCS